MIIFEPLNSDEQRPKSYKKLQRWSSFDKFVNSKKYPRENPLSSLSVTIQGWINQNSIIKSHFSMRDYNVFVEIHSKPKLIIT